MDAIQHAIAAKKKVEFRNIKYDESKEEVIQHGGATCVEMPMQLVYMNDSHD